MSELKTIDSSGAGMGDAVVATWIAEGARSIGEEICFVNCVHTPVIEALGHRVVEAASGDCMRLGSGSGTYEEELRTSERDISPRVFRWQRTVGWEFPIERPQLSKLHEGALQWAHAISGDEAMVVIAPKANFESRSVPLQKWLRIAWALKREGIRTIAIDRNKSAVDDFPFYAHGFDWNHIVALLSKASVVAGNDSGIPHIAATLGIPTVVGMGPTKSEIVFGHCKDVLETFTSKFVDCTGCHFSAVKGYQAACDHGCDALQTIDWVQIKDRIVDLVNSRSSASGKQNLLLHVCNFDENRN